MRLIVALFPIFISTIVYSQGIDTLIYKYDPPDTVKYWEFRGNIGLNFQAVGFKDWSKGGTPSVSLASNMNIIARYEKNGHYVVNKIDAGYGMILERSDDGSDRGLVKNDDFIILILKYSRKIVNNWYLDGIIDFRSQFAKGFSDKENVYGDYPLISEFLSPGTLSPSIGVGFKEQKFSFTLSPISGKLTFVLDDSLTRVPSNGVLPGQHIKSEAGASIALSNERTAMENVFFKYNIRLFTAFNNFNIKHTDIFCEFYTRFKVNKLLSSNLNLRLVYDDNYDPEGTNNYPVQLNYMFNFGIIYDLWKE